LDSAVLFSRDKQIDIKCINNLFSVVSSFYFYNSENIGAAAKKLLKMPLRFPEIKGGSFRIIIMDCGKLRAVDNKIMNTIEKRISFQTGLLPNRANPDTEIWLNRRNNGMTYFMVRIKKHSSMKSYDSKLKKGELRPDIADVMIHKAKIGKQSIVADIFGGWGAIAAAVTENGEYKKVYTGDIDCEYVEYQKVRLHNKRDCIVQKWNAFMLPLEDSSVDSVITDPPWGEYEKIGDIAGFYDGFIGETLRVLRNGGTFVFLSSAHDYAKKALEKYNFDYYDIPLKINGKDTFLFCAEKNTRLCGATLFCERG